MSEYASKLPKAPNAKLLRRIERLLRELAEAIGEYATDCEHADRAVGRREEKNVLSAEQLLEDFELLKERFRHGDDPRQFLADFIRGKPKEYLRAFLKANHLPIDPKESKSKLVDTLASFIREGEAISGRVARVSEP